MKVRYSEIKDWPGNRVGTDGSFWTKWRRVGNSNRKWEITRTWRKVEPWTRGGRYAIIALHGLRRSKRAYVHRLVLEAFVGPCPKGMECRHFPDPNPLNNKLENLKWGTPSQNQKDRVKHGTYQYGEKNPAAKLSDEEVCDLIELWKTGDYTQQQLSEMFHVSRPHVSQIVNGNRRGVK